MMNEKNSLFWTDKPSSEHHNVFVVTQLASGTVLADLVGADFIRIAPRQKSEIHRHNQSRTVILIIRGRGVAVLDGQDHHLETGDRLFIDSGVFHGFRTEEVELEFISVQSPPILDHAIGHFDKELHPDSIDDHRKGQ